MSVKEYAYTLLERYSSDEYSKLRTLLVDPAELRCDGTEICRGIRRIILLIPELTAVQKGEKATGRGV